VSEALDPRSKSWNGTSRGARHAVR